ncbi:myb-related protein a isoform x3 [Nannochloropsis oceanica]
MPSNFQHQQHHYHPHHRKETQQQRQDNGPAATLAEWRKRTEMGKKRMKMLLDEYHASLSERQATFYREVEAVHQAREVDIVPHNMQSYFTSYWQDERGKRPPTVGQSKAIKLHLQRLSEALEENGWTTTEEKIFKQMVLDEKAAIHARLKLKGRSAPPLWGRMTEAQRAEDSRVEALIDWRKISEKLRRHHPKRLRLAPRPVLALLTHWKNKVSVPPTFTAEEKERLRQLVQRHKEHEWEEVAKRMGTGHSGIQCLREYQRGGGGGGGGEGRGKGRGGGAITSSLNSLAAASSAHIKHGLWTRDEDGRLAAAVGMYADNWSLVSDHVATRTASQCRHRQNSLLMDKTPFSREEQKRLILATKAYAPEVWKAVQEGKQRPTESNLMAHEGGGSGGYWGHIAGHLPGRTDGQCRSRWYQTFHPHTNRGDWGEEEVGRLERLFEAYGPDWVKIAGEIGTGRTRQQVKQMWARMMRAEAKQARKREKEAQKGKEKEEKVAKKRKKGGATEDYEEDQCRGEGRGGGGREVHASGATRSKGERLRKSKLTAAEMATEKKRKGEQVRERRASGLAKSRKRGRGMRLEEEESDSNDEEGEEGEEEEDKEGGGEEEEGEGARHVKGKRRRRGSVGSGDGIRGGRGGGSGKGVQGIEKVTAEMGGLAVTTRTRRGEGREGVLPALPTAPLPPLDANEQEVDVRGL